MLYTIARTVIASFFGAWFAWLGWGAQGILLGGLLGVLLAAVPSTIEVWRKHSISLPRREDIMLLIRFGGPLAISFSIGAVILVTDRIVIEHFIGLYALGIYGAAFQLADRIMRTLIQPLGDAALPIVIKEFETSGKLAAIEQFRKNWILLIAISVPALFGLWAVTPDLVPIAVGAEYRQGVAALVPIIALSTFINAIRSNYFDHAFHIGERTKLLLIQTMIIAVINLVASIWLIGQYGLNGAAYGTALAQLVGILFSATVGRLSVKLPLVVGDTLKIFVSATVMWGVLNAITFPNLAIAALTLKVLVGAVTYACCIAALNPFELRQQTVQTVRARVLQ